MRQIPFKCSISCFLFITLIFIPSYVLIAKEDSELSRKNPLDLEFTFEGEKLEYFTDVFYFKTANENEYNVEIWYKIPNPNLKFVPPKDETSEEKLVANLIIALNTYSEGNKIENKCHIGTVNFSLDDEKNATDSGKSVLGSLNFTLSSGVYLVKFGITDIESGKLGIDKIKFVIPEYDSEKIALSSFKFADRFEDPLKKGSDEDIYFVENIGKRIFPNLERTYKTDSELIFYYEIYNLATTSENKPYFDVTYYFNRLEKSGNEDEITIKKVFKQKISCPNDAQGNFSPQVYMLKLPKEFKSSKSDKMIPLFVPGQYEVILDIVDHNRKDGENEKKVKFNFTIED